MPRRSSGAQLRLLSEEEEDVHLAEGMRAEENVFSIDYDVWIDEKNGEVKIEKYPGHLQALKCNSCGFYTMKVVREEITRQPGKDVTGELIKHYQCYYCKSVRATAFNISTREADDYRSMAKHSFKKKRTLIWSGWRSILQPVGKSFLNFKRLDKRKNFWMDTMLKKHPNNFVYTVYRIL